MKKLHTKATDSAFQFFIPRRKWFFDIDFYLIIAGFLVGALLTQIQNFFPGIGSSLIFTTIAIFVMLLLWGGVGFIWVLRREVFVFFLHITGVPAVLLGIFTLTFFWGSAIVVLIRNVPNF